MSLPPFTPPQWRAATQSMAKMSEPELEALRVAEAEEQRSAAPDVVKQECNIKVQSEAKDTDEALVTTEGDHEEVVLRDNVEQQSVALGNADGLRKRK